MFTRRKFRLIVALGMIACLYMAFAAVVRASGMGTEEIIIATNAVVNYHLQKDRPSVMFALTNQLEEPYLWIMARGSDKRKIEHAPGGLLKIEVNGVEIGPDRSVLQGAEYRTPLHPTPYKALEPHVKYRPAVWQREENSGWFFKYDADFVMNDQILCLPKHHWNRRYATDGLNHWYAFNVRGIATNGVNRVTLSEQVAPGAFKSGNYDGFMVGALGFGSLEDMQQRVADYEKQQNSKIDSAEMYTEEKYKKEFDKAYIPEGKGQRFAVQEGYIHRDGKPFFMAYGNPCMPGNRGRESVYAIYNYFGLISVISAGDSFRTYEEVMNLPVYLKPGWEKYHPKPDEIRTFLHESNLIYGGKMLTILYTLAAHHAGNYIEKNYPGLFAQTVDGKWALTEPFAGNNPFGNHAAPLYQEYLRQSHTMLGREFKDHPGVFGASLWEEMGWRVWGQVKKLIPQSPEDLKRYREWLVKKYGTIGRLNEEWGLDYKFFDDLKFPEYREQTANFANFQLWRAEATVKCAEIMYEAFKGAAPDQLVLGQKTYGDIGLSAYYWEHDVDNWALTEWVDVSREYSAGVAMAHLGRASCRASGGKTMEANLCFSACEFRQWDKTNEWHNLLDLKGKAAYPHVMKIVFNGSKAIHWEMYDLLREPSFHFIHYNKLWGAVRPAGPQTFHYENIGTADVVVEERTLKIARAQQLVMRNASLFLPASVPKSDVAMLMTTASRMIGHDPQDKLAKTKTLIQGWVNNPGHDFYVLGSLFDNLHLTFDCVEERIIDDIFKYKVLIVGYQANVMSRKTAEKIKEYVKKGGTVLFYPEAGTWDSVNFQKDKSVNEMSPGFGLSELCGAKIDNEKIIEQKGIVVKTEINGYKAGTVMTNRYYGVKLESTGGEVIATTEDGQPVLVKGANGKAWYFSGYLGLAYYQSHDEHERFARLVEGILKSAGVEKRVEIEGTTDRRKVIPGLLEGEGYWLVGVNNFDDQAQKLKIKVNGIPDEKYEVVDISGEGFTFEKGQDGNCHMKPDPEGAKVKYLTEKVTGTDLAKTGFEGDVGKYMGKVWLIRPAGVDVWMNSTKEALRSYVDLKKPLKIVLGHGCNEEEQKHVEELRKILAGKELTVKVVKDNEIKTKVVEGNLVEDGYELEKYRHEVIDDDANLILIGNASENNVVKHLETAGNYVFNKVPEIVDDKYPGKGRGIIQLVESINHVSYDATDKGRDAILAGGSDQEGTIKAIRRLILILR